MYISLLLLLLPHLPSPSSSSIKCHQCVKTKQSCKLVARYMYSMSHKSGATKEQKKNTSPRNIRVKLGEVSKLGTSHPREYKYSTG